MGGDAQSPPLTNDNVTSLVMGAGLVAVLCWTGGATEWDDRGHTGAERE